MRCLGILGAGLTAAVATLFCSGCQQFEEASRRPPASLEPMDASDKGITVTPRSPEELALSRKLQRYAVIVGISDYKCSPEIPDLQFAAKDAKAIYDFLVSPAGGGFPRGNVKLLLDRDATIVNVRSALNDFLAAPVEDDLVVIYFGGHGAPDPKNPANLYLLCHDTHPKRFGGSALPMREIDLALRYNIRSQRVIVLTDACHAAGIGAEQGRKVEASQLAAEQLNAYWRKLAASRTGITKIAASESDQVSQENIRWGGGHGVFTYHLLEGLGGAADGWVDDSKDGFVTIAETYEYLRDRVRRETRNAQCPWAGPYKDNSIPLGIVDVAVREQVAARQRSEEREATSVDESSYTSVQVPVESDKAIALAMGYLQRGKDAEARQIVDAVLARHDKAEPDAMAMKIDFLLQDGNVDAAEDLQLRLGVTHPGHDKARVAARLVYDFYRHQMAEQQVPEQIKVLSRFLKRNPDSPHTTEAEDMRRELQGQLEASYMSMVSGHVKMAVERTKRHEFEKASAELEQAQAALDEALRDHGLRLASTGLDAARAQLAQEKQTAALDAVYEQARTGAAKSELIDAVLVWQRFVRSAAGSPHLGQARKTLDECTKALTEKLQTRFASAISAAERALSGKQFAEAETQLKTAFRCIADAQRAQLADLTGAESVDALAKRLLTEKLRHEDDLAYQSLLAKVKQRLTQVAGARAAVATQSVLNAFDAAAQLCAEFATTYPDSAHLGEVNEERERIARQKTGFIETEYLRAMSTAREAYRTKDFTAASSALRVALLLRPDDDAARALETQMRPVLVVTSEPSGASVQVDGKDAGATPLRYEGVSKGQTVTVSVTKPRWQADPRQVSIDRGGEIAVHLDMEECRGPAPGGEWTVPELGLELVPVEAGTFQMGSSDGGSDEKPVHEVRITRAFWMGKYEVTQAQYEKLMGENPSHFKGARNPVEQVSWSDAMAFCEKLTARERAAGRLPDGYEYRLPTEAEWEYAARGGPNSRGFTYSGADDLAEVGWYGGNSGRRTHAVGEKRANELGIYDMSGNVWEWCLDGYDDDYYGRSPGVDPMNASAASNRVLRGGSWGSDARYCRVANRSGFRPEVTGSSLGFRVCLARIVRR